MSNIGYRDWEIWTNKDYFGSDLLHRGFYELKITAALMAGQTIQYLYEQAQRVRQNEFIVPSKVLSTFIHPLVFQGSSDEGLILRKYEQLKGDDSLLVKTIEQILHELDALSLSVDFPLNCTRIQYTVIASRRW